MALFLPPSLLLGGLNLFLFVIFCLFSLMSTFTSYLCYVSGLNRPTDQPTHNLNQFKTVLLSREDKSFAFCLTSDLRHQTDQKSLKFIKYNYVRKIFFVFNNSTQTKSCTHTHNQSFSSYLHNNLLLFFPKQIPKTMIYFL